jgi:hypothetical protein
VKHADCRWLLGDEMLAREKGFAVFLVMFHGVLRSFGYGARMANTKLQD